MQKVWIFVDISRYDKYIYIVKSNKINLRKTSIKMAKYKQIRTQRQNLIHT